MKIRTIFCLLCALCLLVGCSATPTPDAAATPTPAAVAPTSTPQDPSQPFVFTADNFPRLDGSTATIPLGEAVQALLTGQPRADCDTYFTGTNSAYVNLMNGDCDIVVAYEMPDNARQIMTGNGEQLEIAQIGLDALVFLINSQNPVQDLTTAQLQGIYSGAYTNWNQVGGADAEIAAYQRNPTSGSQTLMDKLVMGDIPLATPPQEYYINDMEGLVDAIASVYNNTKPAIGYNVYYYVTQMNTDPAISLLSVDGVAPTTATIADGSYPFANPFYVAIRADAPASSPERILFDWLQSPDGQALVAHEGYAAGLARQ